MDNHAQLIRLYAYLDTTGPIALRAELSPEDLDEVQLVMWSDADWAGDPEDTQSFWIIARVNEPK